MQSKSLPEEAVPGASLSGRKPEDLKVPELKTWLTCRGLPTKGKKADLIARYRIAGNFRRCKFSYNEFRKNFRSFKFRTRACAKH